MKLSELKKILSFTEAVNFVLPNGTSVPEHFHVTEVGAISKHFIDCGGTVRKENVINFQLWDANDYEHRLKPQKLLNIIALSEKVLQTEDDEIEVEYQTETIGKYSLDFNGKDFLLISRKTACLAKENCGTPEKSILPGSEAACCSMHSKCC